MFQNMYAKVDSETFLKTCQIWKLLKKDGVAQYSLEQVNHNAYIGTSTND